jgi:folate-binding protein YgfZ
MVEQQRIETMNPENDIDTDQSSNPLLSSDTTANLRHSQSMVRLPLEDVHLAANGVLERVGDGRYVTTYSTPETEYYYTCNSVGLIDLCSRGRLCLTGADRVRFLHGQVTNDVRSLNTGGGCQATLVTAKGKIQADLTILALEQELLLDFEPGLTTELIDRFEHYIIADDVQVVDVAPHYGLLSLQGPRSIDVLQRLGWPVPPPSKAPSFVVHPSETGSEIYVAFNNRVGVCGIDLYIPLENLSEYWARIVEATQGCGGGPIGFTALEWRRIEAGIPRFGLDLDNSHLAPEGGDEYVRKRINYGKGCYIGQEILARIRTYGKVTKALRGLLPPEDLMEIPPPGSRLFHGGKEVGRLTSSVQSPTLRRFIALGMVRKECNAPGTILELELTKGRVPVEVAPLPFIPDAIPPTA